MIELFRSLINTFSLRAREQINPELIRRQMSAIALTFNDLPLFMFEVGFLFAEIDEIDRRFESEIEAKFAQLKTQNPHWTVDQAWTEFTRIKSNLIIFTRANRSKNVVYQCLAILVSNWIKAKSRTYCRILAKLKATDDETEFRRILDVGTRYKKKPWALAMIKASDFVRHREEWQFVGLKYDPWTKSIKTQKRILSTMTVGKSKKTAQFLIELGIKETSLFGFSGDACTQIFDALASSDKSSFESNCRNWLDALKSHCESEITSLLRRFPESINQN